MINVSFVALDMLASVTRSDAHPTGDQEVAGSIPMWTGNILSIVHEIFSTVILSLLLIQEGQLSVSGKRMFAVTDKLLQGLSLPRKSV